MFLADDESSRAAAGSLDADLLAVHLDVSVRVASA